MAYGPTSPSQFSCAMLANPDQEKILQVIFLQKNDHMVCANIALIIFWWNVVVFRQHQLENIAMKCWEPPEQRCTGVYLYNVAHRVLRKD